MKMTQRVIAVSIGLALFALGGCGKKEAPETPAAQVAPAAAQPAPEAAAPPAPPPSAEELAKATETRGETLEANDTTWTPEALEELLAPIALYPDTVLEQVLVASTNPQEVLDAGNWLFENPSLKGKALDQAADEKGFTPPVLSLIQFPETVDMLCQEMPWTTELGQAYVNDQAGVLDAIQRLRRQAKEVGTLQSSPKMTVASEKVGNVEYVTVSPPSPEVVYVPQYDPVAAYAPQPATTVAAPSTTTVVQEGHSTSSLVTTGLLAFGAGMLVNEIFDDDDDDYCRRYYYSYRCRGGSYWGRPPYYYPPYPYRPRYGNGFYPSYGYNHRPGYNNRPGFNNNNNSFNNNNVNININNNNNDYWNRFDNDNAGFRQPRTVRSPITVAKPKRNDLNTLNRQAAKGPKRIAPSRGPEFNDRDQFKAAKGVKNAKAVQGSYKGAKPGADRMAAGKAASQAARRDLPKVQGSYAGKDNNRMPSRDAVSKGAAKPAALNKAKPAQRPDIARNKPTGDRGYGSGQTGRDRMERPQPSSVNRPQAGKVQKPQADRAQRPQVERPQAKPAQQRPQVQRPQQQRPQVQRPQQRNSRPSAVSRPAGGGTQARAASQRGRQSMPSGARNRPQQQPQRRDKR